MRCFCRMRSASSNVVAHGYGHEILFRHHRAHQLRMILFKSQVAVWSEFRSAASPGNGNRRSCISS